LEALLFGDIVGIISPEVREPEGVSSSFLEERELAKAPRREGWSQFNSRAIG
jgi:hypothetical protein